jgi:glycosyltransferase involved in cell wall biosynthesis
VSQALQRILGDAELRSRLIAAGLETAADFAWERRIDKLESFFTEVAATAPRRSVAPRG